MFFDACVLLLVTSCRQSLDPKFKLQKETYLISVNEQTRSDHEEVTLILAILNHHMAVLGVFLKISRQFTVKIILILFSQLECKF